MESLEQLSERIKGLEKKYKLPPHAGLAGTIALFGGVLTMMAKEAFCEMIGLQQKVFEGEELKQRLTRLEKRVHGKP